MKEFIVCYTLEDDIKRERIMKKADISKVQVIQEIVEKIEQRKYFLTKGDHGDYWINRSSIRYIEFMKKMTRNLITLNYNIDTSFLSYINFNYLYMGENMNV